MSEHSPAPWKSDSSGLVWDAEGENVLEVIGTGPRASANAALAAAAPELVAALEGAVRWLDNIAAGAPPLIDGRAAERQVMLGMPNNVLGRDAMRELVARARALGVAP
jgi:hypothetical protein